MFVAVSADEKSSFLWGEVTLADATIKQSMGAYLADKEDFLRCLLVCHDCTIIEMNLPNGEKRPMLTGASLDEQCLLN